MQTKKRGGSLRLLLTLALLSAIGIILGKFLAFNITDFMRFSLENLTILLCGIAFGPIPGLAVGIVQDIVGCLLRGYILNPIITVGSGTVGLVAGLVYKYTDGMKSGLRIAVSVIPAHLVGSVLIKSLGLVIYYSLPFTATVLWRILNYVIVGAIEVILLIYLLKSKLLFTEIQKIRPYSRTKKGDEEHDI